MYTKTYEYHNVKNHVFFSGINIQGINNNIDDENNAI